MDAAGIGALGGAEGEEGLVRAVHVEAGGVFVEHAAIAGESRGKLHRGGLGGAEEKLAEALGAGDDLAAGQGEHLDAHAVLVLEHPGDGGAQEVVEGIAGEEPAILGLVAFGEGGHHHHAAVAPLAGDHERVVAHVERHLGVGLHLHGVHLADVAERLGQAPCDGVLAAAGQGVDFHVEAAADVHGQQRRQGQIGALGVAEAVGAAHEHEAAAALDEGQQGQVVARREEDGVHPGQDHQVVGVEGHEALDGGVVVQRQEGQPQAAEERQVHALGRRSEVAEGLLDAVVAVVAGADVEDAHAGL